MKNLKKIALNFSAVCLALNAHAAIYSTNIANVHTNYASGSGLNQFNVGNGYYNRGDSLNDTPVGAAPANQWQTTDPYDPINDVGGTSQMQFIPKYTGGEGPSGADAGNNSVYWGGYDLITPVVPGVTNPSLYYNFNQQFSTFTANPGTRLVNATFTSDFALFPSGSPAGYNDTFGYSFWSAGGPGVGSLLAQVQFTNINSTSFGVALNGVDAGVLAYGSLYSLQAVFDYNNQLNLSFAGVTAQTNGVGVVTNFARGAYTFVGAAGASTDLFESASIDWELASGTPGLPGDNYMIINSVEIATAVTPEPSTVLAGVFLAAVTAYTTVRRRRQAKAEVVA
jgi:hypothetical protein